MGFSTVVRNTAEATRALLISLLPYPFGVNDDTHH